jgi:predicted membrane-bound mannosyltransferase
MKNKSGHSSWLEQPVAPFLSKITLEHVLIVLIILITLFSRFYILDLRVMSHDETNHVVPSYDLYMGRGYRHDPVTHGPFQFHIVALTYFLLGDNDFTSRIPAALFSTAAVAFVLIFFRRYLGKVGGILAGIFFMISPYMLFYGRYTRNEAFIMLFGVVMLYSVLRYLENGKNKWLYFLTLATVMHYCSKETAYIYSAELLVFLGGLALYDLIRYQWQSSRQRSRFIFYTGSSVLIFLGAAAISILFIRISKTVLQPATLLTSPISNLGGAAQQLGNYLQTYGPYFLPIIIPMVVGVLLLLGIRKRLQEVWNELNDLRSFDLLILTGTLVLPLLSPVFSKLAGIDPIDYTNQMGIYTTFFFILYIFCVAYIFGTAWKKEIWLKNAAIFYVIFTIFYTTIFTNGFGFFTGIVGGLGYWMAQHGLQRGNQPLYYYALIQIPIYEFLAACGTILAFILGIRYKKLWFGKQKEVLKTEKTISGKTLVRKPTPVLWLLLFWSFVSLITFSIAGEKMPWLTVHIVLAMLLCAGWSIGFLFNQIYTRRNSKKFWLAFLAAVIFMVSLSNLFIILLGNQPPFQGKTQQQLQQTNYFLFALLLTGALAYAVFYFTKKWRVNRIGQLLTLAVFCLMILLTARAAYFASFVNYDLPTEFLVYAHAATGPKEILSQIEEISQRTTLGLGIKVAYDNHSRYPFWWYFRHFPNRVDYSENPTKSLEESPVIVAGQANYSKLDPLIRNNYYSYEYMRLWWPMMDYYNLTPQRVWDAISNGEMRQALFNIWLNRDYSLYAQKTNNPSLTLENWSPAEKMRLYIRKDIAAQIWNLGVSTSITQTTDPYIEKTTEIQPSQIISGGGNAPGQLAAPRGIAIAADDSIYVADSHNNRIQHFATDGKLINSWGTYANIIDGSAPAGTFNEPWGIAVGPDGSIYVTDTWNYRIQKFSPLGEFIRMWGTYNIGSSPQGLYGPRGIIVDKDGKVFVTDTGNKRVVIYDSDGNYLSEFGSAGLDVGNLDEPVGITMDNEGKIYIADTWNRRVQVFQPDQTGLTFSYVTSWDVIGWFGQSTNNKPFITVSPTGNIFLSDPEGSRILEFSTQGEFIHGWTGFNLSEDISSQPVDLKFDSMGRLWVSDAASNILMAFNDLQSQPLP